MFRFGFSSRNPNSETMTNTCQGRSPQLESRMVLHSVLFQKQHVPCFWQPGNVVQGKAKEPTEAQSLEDLRRNDFFAPKSDPHLSFITPF